MNLIVNLWRKWDPSNKVESWSKANCQQFRADLLCYRELLASINECLCSLDRIILQLTQFKVLYYNICNKLVFLSNNIELKKRAWQFLSNLYPKLRKVRKLCKSWSGEPLAYLRTLKKVCAIWLPVFSYFSLMNQNWVQELILAWLWRHFHLALDGDRTHNLLIVTYLRTYIKNLCIELDKIGFLIINQ